jgi:aspartate-semialdehyde dehydrogenase
MPAIYKIAIVGAASLCGKEINEVLGESVFAASSFVLMDDEESLGQLESVADEVTFIQRIDPDSFAHVDFTFFTGTPEVTRKHWGSALAAGSSILDLSSALEREAGVLVRAPWVGEELGSLALPDSPDLKTPAIVPAHPASAALALLLLRLKTLSAINSASATVLEPASEFGRAAMDELHQQTVSLLSFQSLPRNVYDTQVAFNTTAAFGEAAKVSLAEMESRIRKHYALLSGGRLPQLAIQLIHVPVFHGQGISLSVEFEKPVTVEQIESALGTGEHVTVALLDGDAPSNLNTAGQGDIQVRVRAESTGQVRQCWIWAAFDNLKLGALIAVACAQELRRLRPHGKVQ